ncbi:MAG: hypothetical protein HOC09_01860 [Deltaproteobacteria bacterium]|nr:hypothetical protein [Deltaproteobacteria bacterium]
MSKKSITGTEEWAETNANLLFDCEYDCKYCCVNGSDLSDNNFLIGEV